nr:unnamed protein product [Digitaria exilis]
MDHKSGWLFNTPVDPVLFGIPDYFDVIRHPMDLGTVKKKLTSKQYRSTTEFAADVRLTFSNAMKYNPPGNHVHEIAKELNGIFDSEWESVERKLRGQNQVKIKFSVRSSEKTSSKEKARIEAQVKAAEAAAQQKLDEEIRMKRQKEREAARLALRMMKKTVDIDNSDFLKELENFSKTCQSNTPGKLIVEFVGGDLPPGLGSPLERLGLFMKQDFEDEVEQEMEDSVSPSMDVDMKKDSEEEVGHGMQGSVSPSTVMGMKEDFQDETRHEMEDSLSPPAVVDTKKDSEEEVEHEMVDSVSPLMDVDTEEGEISC